MPSKNTKAKNAREAKYFEQIPNVGKAVAEDLRILGFNEPKDLIAQDGIALYHKLNEVTGMRHDPCMADTLMAVVDFMNGGKANPWWHFTPKRKQILGY